MNSIDNQYEMQEMLKLTWRPRILERGLANRNNMAATWRWTKKSSRRGDSKYTRGMMDGRTKKAGWNGWFQKCLAYKKDRLPNLSQWWECIKKRFLEKKKENMPLTKKSTIQEKRKHLDQELDQEKKSFNILLFFLYKFPPDIEELCKK